MSRFRPPLPPRGGAVPRGIEALMRSTSICAKRSTKASNCEESLAIGLDHSVTGLVSLHALWTLADLGVLDDEPFVFHIDAILKTPRGNVEDEPSDGDRLPRDAGPGHAVQALRNSGQHRLKSCANAARHFVERFRERDDEQGWKPIDGG